LKFENPIEDVNKKKQSRKNTLKGIGISGTSTDLASHIYNRSRSKNHLTDNSVMINLGGSMATA